MQRHGKASINIKMVWGETQVWLRRWRCAKDKLVVTSYPQGMDKSGLSPIALERCLDLATRLPFREACSALKVQGFEMTLSHCERLSQRYGETLLDCLEDWRDEQELVEIDEQDHQEQETFVIEVDGVMVMEKDKPVKGQCEGREVKQVLIHPLGDSSKKHHLAQACNSHAFEPYVTALLKQVGISKQTSLIAIADAAPWIDDLFEGLAVKQRILDVYHATEYLDKVMKALGYTAEQRQAERASWCRGDINARVWFEHHLSQHRDTSGWSDEAQDALTYLQKRFDQMDYWSFKEQGFPIGSGAIEGANKSVIGARMKRSGMRWSHHGINRMAAMRSLQTTANPWFDFHHIRLQAFN